MPFYKNKLKYQTFRQQYLLEWTQLDDSAALTGSVIVAAIGWELTWFNYRLTFVGKKYGLLYIRDGKYSRLVRQE